MKGYYGSECSMSIQILGIQSKAAVHRATKARVSGPTEIQPDHCNLYLDTQHTVRPMICLMLSGNITLSKTRKTEE